MKHLNARIKAAVIHTSLSLLAFSIILFFMLTQWFPSPLFSAEGGWQALEIVLFVDIVLGPCLTFLIFSPDKKRKELIFDLSFIAIVQISALSWGVNQAYQAQVIAISYLEHKETFYPIKLIDAQKQNISPNVFYDLDTKNTPSVLHSQRPNKNDYDSNTESIVATYHGIQEHTQLKLLKNFRETPITIVNLINSGNDEDLRKIRHWQSTNNNQNKLTFARYKGSFSTGILILDASYTPIDFIEKN